MSCGAESADETRDDRRDVRRACGAARCGVAPSPPSPFPGKYSRIPPWYLPEDTRIFGETVRCSL